MSLNILISQYELCKNTVVESKDKNVELLKSIIAHLQKQKQKSRTKGWKIDNSGKSFQKAKLDCKVLTSWEGRFI